MILILFVVLTGLSTEATNIVTPEEFTKLYRKRMLSYKDKVKTVKIIEDLQLKVILTDEEEYTHFLDNAYTTYKQDPKELEDVLSRYVTAGMESFTKTEEALLKDNIVPVVKDSLWISDIQKAAGKLVPVYEALNDDLIILYAFDSQHNIRYMSKDELKELNIDKQNLRSLAIKNLGRILPKIEKHGGPGLYILTAGGDYESSLLLFDKIWNGDQFEVQGDLVVAIPSRDLLLVTGSEDSEGLKKVKKIVKKTISEGTYTLTPKLFIYKKGSFIEFKE